MGVASVVGVVIPARLAAVPWFWPSGRPCWLLPVTGALVSPADDPLQMLVWCLPSQLLRFVFERHSRLM